MLFKIAEMIDLPVKFPIESFSSHSSQSPVPPTDSISIVRLGYISMGYRCSEKIKTIKSQFRKVAPAVAKLLSVSVATSLTKAFE